MVFHFWYPYLVKICQLNLSVILHFRYLHIGIDQLTILVENQLCLSKEFQYRVPQKMCLLYSTAFGHSHFFLEFPLQKVILALDLVTPWVGNLDAWFNSHSNFNACRIWRFENRTPILFFYQAPNPRVVVEMSFYKHVIWCNLKKIIFAKHLKTNVKSLFDWLASLYF